MSIDIFEANLSLLAQHRNVRERRFFAVILSFIQSGVSFDSKRTLHQILLTETLRVVAGLKTRSVVSLN